jgi:hypothetical protein
MSSIGSQSLMRISPRTHYDFRELRDGSVSFPIAQRIDVLGYERATLQVRVHSGAFPKGASIEVRLADDGFSAEDPGSNFLQTKTPSGEEIGVLRLVGPIEPPFYQTLSTEISGKIGRFLAVTISARGAKAGGPSAVVSLDLVLSGGRVGSSFHQPSTYLGYALDVVDRPESFEELGAASVTSEPLNQALIHRLSDAVREVLARGGHLGGEYPRFSNVNVGAQPGGEYPRFANVNVGSPGTLAGGGEYPRFANVNVGREELDPGRFAEAVIEQANVEAKKRE